MHADRPQFLLGGRSLHSYSGQSNIGKQTESRLLLSCLSWNDVATVHRRAIVSSCHLTMYGNKSQRGIEIKDERPGHE